MLLADCSVQILMSASLGGWYTDAIDAAIKTLYVGSALISGKLVLTRLILSALGVGSGSAQVLNDPEFWI